MADTIYEFGGFRLDAAQRVLADAAGKPVPLAPRVFDTLLYLVENAGQLVEKNALIEAVWPDVTVEDNSLSQNISTLRRALGDQTGDNRFIVTAPGRGYRFVAKVLVVADDEPAPASQATPKEKPVEPKLDKVRVSVAVMPFANLTGDPEKEYFSDGMAEEIINLLTRTSVIRAPSRTSSFAYRGRNIDVRQIAEDLGVDAVLEGSVRAAGERVRVTAQLIDGVSGFHLWSDTFDRDMTDVFALQDELALSILEAMQNHLNAPLSKKRRPRPRPKDHEAYRLYLQGDYLLRNNAGDIPVAIGHFREALERDPTFAAAQAGLARAKGFSLSYVKPTRERLAELENDARRALALDPQSEAGHGALGTFYAQTGKLCDAEGHMRMAFEIGRDPMIANALSVMVFGNVGHLRRAIQISEDAYRSFPLAPFLLVAIAMFHISEGDEERAALYAARALELGHLKSSVPMCDVLALMAARNGRYEEAADLVLASMPPYELSGGVTLAVREAYLALGDPSRRENALKLLHDPGVTERLGVTPINYKRMMLWRVMLGDVDGAFEWTDRIVASLEEEGAVGMIWAVIWLEEMEPFRAHPRFMDIAERLGFVAYWSVYGPPDGYDFRDGKLISLQA